MTIYSEDPHDNWQVASLRPAKDHTGRSQFWLITFAALTVFWMKRRLSSQMNNGAGMMRRIVHAKASPVSL